jgi:putative flippase GtrA
MTLFARLDALPIAKLLRFAAVGFSLMALHIGLGYALLHLAGLSPLLASLLAYLGAALAGYLSQRMITFRSDTPHATSIPRFAAMILLGLAVSWLAAAAGKLFGYSPMTGIIFGSMLTPVANYVIMDRLVFPDQR